MSITIGDTVHRHDHTYEVIAFKAHTCRTGKEIELVRLASECIVCGARYRVMATRSQVGGSRRWNVTRTCPDHRGLGPRWRRLQPLMDVAITALAERPATFLTARQLAEASGRSASGMGNALRRAFAGAPSSYVKTPHGRLVRRVGRYQTAMYLLIPRGERHAARVEREAWAAVERTALAATAAARVRKLDTVAALRRQTALEREARLARLAKRKAHKSVTLEELGL